MKLIKLTKGEYALVDDIDYKEVNRHAWCLNDIQFYKNGLLYALTTMSNKKISMYRLIMKPKQGIEVDHIDGNGLNNQRYNLRLVTHSQNQHNHRRARRDSTTGVTGVYWNKPNKKYQAQITINKVYKYLGLFANLNEARDAVELARKAVWET